MEMLKKVFGFTLAEVLITLGVIGVVAAMIIPTLMTNLQNRKLESQFKEAYSILSQAFKSWQDDGLENRHYSRFMPYFTDKSTYCSLTSTDHANGIACAYYAMSDSGYFRKLKK